METIIAKEKCIGGDGVVRLEISRDLIELISAVVILVILSPILARVYEDLLMPAVKEIGKLLHLLFQTIRLLFVRTDKNL